MRSTPKNPPHSPLPTPYSPFYAQITITDTGKGIQPDFLPHVFDYFRQEDGSITRQFGGLGLGLAIARQVVELHGGTIQAESLGEGQGATFTVRLPLAREVGEQGSGGAGEMGGWGDEGMGSRGASLIADHSELPDSVNMKSLSGLRLLVVDDNDETREFLLFLLEEQGAIVTTATCVREALNAIEQDVIEQNRFDLVLSDIAMPEEDGYMLIKKLHQTEAGRSIPAIALTAYAGESNQQDALQAGFHRHITKPIDPDAVIEAIVNLLASHSQAAYPV